MPNANALKELVAKELHVYYILDTSGSMAKEPIAALNDAMRATVKELEKINKTNADADFKICVLQFNSDVGWVTVDENGQPIVQDLEDFVWVDLNATGLTELGDALMELSKMLSRNYLQKSTTGNKAPVIIFMSDGGPTDTKTKWADGLAELNKNAWYQQAIKIAFALGDSADTDVLRTVVGKDGGVIKTSDLETFKALIKVVSVTSSLAASVSKPKDSTPTGGSIAEQVTGLQGQDEGGVFTVPAGGLTEPDPYGNGGYTDVNFGNQVAFT